MTKIKEMLCMGKVELTFELMLFLTLPHCSVALNMNREAKIVWHNFEQIPTPTVEIRHYNDQQITSKVSHYFHTLKTSFLG